MAGNPVIRDNTLALLHFLPLLAGFPFHITQCRMADESGMQSEGAGLSTSENGDRLTNMSAGQPVVNAMMMPWFRGVPWIPKFNRDQAKISFSEWNGQVQAMLRGQGLNEEQKMDFIVGALEGEA